MTNIVQTNKGTVRDFYDVAFNQKKPAAAVAKHLWGRLPAAQPRRGRWSRAIYRLRDWIRNGLPGATDHVQAPCGRRRSRSRP